MRRSSKDFDTCKKWSEVAQHSVVAPPFTNFWNHVLFNAPINVKLLRGEARHRRGI